MKICRKLFSVPRYAVTAQCTMISPPCQFVTRRVRSGTSAVGLWTMVVGAVHRCSRGGSTGGGGGAFYEYSPADAYDGCEYTKWTPAQEPTEAEPQWLRFDFKEPVELDGISVLPYGPAPAGPPPVELSSEGQEFSPAALSEPCQASDRVRGRRRTDLGGGMATALSSRRWAAVSSEHRTITSAVLSMKPRRIALGSSPIWAQVFSVSHSLAVLRGETR